MSMPDPQLKRKLKKREETRVRILKKKNEGIYHFLVSSQLLFGNSLTDYFINTEEEAQDSVEEEEQHEEIQR